MNAGSCHSDEFRCYGDERCIPGELKCDGYDNCGDWDDESTGACGLSEYSTVTMTTVVTGMARAHGRVV